LLGDLAAAGRGTRTAEELVAELARKFDGSGTSANVDYLSLCRGSLAGAQFAMDGRIVPQNLTVVDSASMGQGWLIQPAEINEAILRWANEEFEEFEYEMASYWRKATREPDQESFMHQLESHGVALPEGGGEAALVRKVDYLLEKSSLQDVWFRWLIDQLDLDATATRAAEAGWRANRSGGLRSFAPFVAHCVRVLLLLLVFTHNGLVAWRPTNLLDVQYLYYAPFCQVFSSNDALHVTLAPHVLRGDQTFVRGTVLKADLGRLATRRDSLSPEERAGEAFALGSYPPPCRESIVFRLWQQYMRPWSPQMVNRATSLSDDARRAAIERVQGMYQAIDA